MKESSKSKRIIVVLAVIVAAAIAAVIVFSLTKNRESTNTFADSGYILVSDPDSDEKTVQFKSGTRWKSGTDASVVFEDVQNNRTTVAEESFVHYTSGTLQALTNGVVVDLDALDGNQFTEHYSISNRIFMTPSGDGYKMTNSTEDHNMSDFIWKLNENKYMLVSDTVSLHFSDDDIREVSGFVELSYIDNGVIQFQTEDNFWQTVSADCYGVLSNGIVVDFSYKNIENEDREVLMDFNKIVVDSEDNVEVQPISESLTNLGEEVIPHFNVNVEDGQDGANGSSGSSGSSGGTLGNGSDGVDGADKPDGEDGKSQQVDGEVLHFPVFTLEVSSESTESAWEIGSTYCKGNIMVSDPKSMLVKETDDGKTGMIYIVDIESGITIESVEQDFSDLYADGYAFKFSDLQPDHAYRLVVDAPIRTSITSDAYVRNFISKAFYTDSTGVYFSLDEVTTTTADVSVITESFSAAVAVDYQIFSTYEAAAAADEDGQGWITIDGIVRDTQQTIKLEQFTDRSPDQTFYLRGCIVLMENDNEYRRLTDQILEITTLKERATVGSPLVTSNRYSWGFDITPGIVSDPNKGIQKYTYEFYYASDVEDGKLNENAQVVKTVVTYSTDSFTVPLDGVNLQAGYSYIVRCVAEFNDNEKTYNIDSGFSNVCTVVGSQMPSVYFTNNSGGTGTVLAGETSDYYDALVGTIHVDQAVTGSRLVLTGLTNADQNTYHPYAIIRASGYYYVKYPIYPADTPDESLPADGKYLTATDNNGYISIGLSDTALSDMVGVDGLKDGVSYSVIIMGNLTEDGVNYTDQNTVVGMCTVSTPKMQGVSVKWTQEATSREFKNISFSFAIDNLAPDEEATATFNRMMTTLNTIELKVYKGIPESTTKEQLGSTVRITSDPNQTDDNPNDGINYMSYSSFSDKESLAAAVVDKMNVDKEFFGITDSDLKNHNVYIEITLAEDYTIKSAKRDNQSAYCTEPDDITEPEMQYVYENIYSMSNTTYEIEIGNTPDSLPADEVEENSFVKNSDNQDIVWYDDDGDNDFSDRAEMRANYANSCKIAAEITYYVFDAPDFYRDYSEADGYCVSSDFARIDNSKLDALDILTAVTAVKKENGTETGNWLGKVTITIGSGGTIPGITFIPQTAENYIGSQSSKNTQKDINDYYATGEYDGQYYLFYNQGSQEPQRGHQFVFAWTIKYVQDSSDQEVRYYPFDLDEYDARKDTGTYGIEGYYSIPHSTPQDKPMKAPEIAAVPWATDYTEITSSSVTGTVTWKAGIEDPDSVVEKNENKKAILYKKNSKSNVTKAAAVLLKQGGEELDLEKFYDNSSWNVSINVGGDKPGKAVTTAVAVQRYTDVYTTAGRNTGSGNPYEQRLFKDSVYISGSADGKYSFSKYAEAADKYYNAFAYYIEPSTVSTKNGDGTEDYSSSIKVSVEGKYCEFDPDTGVYSECNLSAYSVTVTGDAEEIKLIDGIRLRFTYTENGKTIECTLDKYLDVDQDNYESININGNEATFTFDILLSRDLGNSLHDVTDKTGVTVTASALYESNKTGFSYVVNNDSNYSFAYRCYKLGEANGLLSVYETASWRFDKTYKLVYSGDDESPYRIGSFFNISKTLNPSYDSETGKITDYSMSIRSTRYWEWADYAVTAKIGLGGSFGRSGTVSVPRVLAETGVKVYYTEYTVKNPEGKVQETENDNESIEINIPAPVKDIIFDDVESYVNGLDVTYTTSSGDETVYYTIQKLDKDATEITEKNFKWQSHNKEEHVWTTDTSASENTITQQFKGDDSSSALEAALKELGGLIDSYTSSSGKGTISIEDLESSSTYKIKIWYWDYDASSKEGRFVRYDNLNSTYDNDKANYIYGDTLAVPEATLSVGFVDSSYTQKSVRFQVDIEKAVNCYYTVELYRHNTDSTTKEEKDDFITYLYAGNEMQEMTVDVGRVASSDSSCYAYMMTADNIKHDAENGVYLDTEGCENLYLDYDATEENGNYYVVRVRIYSIGSGPAWDKDSISTDLFRDNEDKSEDNAEEKARKQVLRNSYIKKLETPYIDSTYWISGEMEVISSDNETYARIKFSPHYTSGSNTFREGKYTFIVIRTTTDGDGETVYQNVTRFVEIAGKNGNIKYEDFKGILDLKQKQNLYLSLNETNFPDNSANGKYPIKQGDTFTFYAYVVQDNKQFIIGTTVRAKTTGDYNDGLTNTEKLADYILAGRGEGSYTFNFESNISADKDILDKEWVAALKKSIDTTTKIDDKNVNSGVSKMPDSMSNAYTITYAGDKVSAGKVNATKMPNDTRVYVTLMNPVGIDSIERVIVSITATYSYTGSDKQEKEATDTWTNIDDYFNENRGGTSSYVITPEFENVDTTLKDFKWVSYVLTIKFQAKDSLGNYYDIMVEKADGDSDATISDDGMTYSKTIPFGN